MIDIKVEGLQETVDAMYGVNIGVKTGGQKMVETVTEAMADGMRMNAPTWRGDLQSSIDTEYRSDRSLHVGIAQTGVPWAAPIELGTGERGPSGISYFPNPLSLEEWALSKGFSSGWHLAFVIFKRGGTDPTHFVENTFHEVSKQALTRGTYKFLEEISP